MARACHTAVRMATGDVFSDKEIDDFLDRLAAKARRKRVAAPTLDERAAIAQAAAELTKEELEAALRAKRLRWATRMADQGRRAQLDNMPATMTPAERLDAYNVGSEKQGLGVSSSVDAEGRARQMALWGQVEIGMSKMPGLMERLANPLGLRNRAFELLVAREISRLSGDASIEPTGDAGALHAARVLVKAREAGRAMQNDAGAWIGHLNGYIDRQSWDPMKVTGSFFREIGVAADRLKAQGLKPEALDMRAIRLAAQARSFGEFRDDFLKWLGPKTWEGLTLDDVPEDEVSKKPLSAELAQVLRDPTDVRERLLYSAWTGIAVGRHADLRGDSDYGDFRPKPSLAAKVSRPRVFHFESPEAWLAANEKYGRASLFASMMESLGRAGRNAALLKRWGPNPEAAFEAEKERLAGQTVVAKEKKALDGYMRQARFDAVLGRGEVGENPTLATIGRTLRGFEAATKLGSIVLSKATDLPLTGHTFARAGAGFLRGYQAFFQGVLHLGTEDAKRAGDALEVGARSFAGHLAAQFLATDGPPGWTSWATRLMYKINAFEWFNNGVRHGGAQVYARILALEAEAPERSKGAVETMQRFGITPAEWEGVRRNILASEPMSDGRRYFGFEHLEHDEDLAWKFRAMVHNVLDDAVSEPRARERSFITQGTKAGTWGGEALRAFFQFKGFINTIVGRHLVPAARGYAGYSPALLLPWMLIGTALAGYVSMSAKGLARGELPKPPIGGSLGEDLEIWSAALAQGGGLGMYGDFLFGEQNRYGNEWSFAQMGGPMWSDAEQVGTIVQQSIHGGDVSPTTGRSPIPAELIRFGSQNIPVINVFYTRLALDWLILWRLQEAASPGYLQRYEQRVQSKEGQNFWLSPTSAE